MQKINNSTNIQEVGRKLCNSNFVAALTETNFCPVIIGTVILWSQVILAWWIALFLPLSFSVIPFVLICACQQAMLVWTHESSHGNLLKNKIRNDLWADLFFATPIGMSVEKYRSHHLAHHAYLSTPKDEERWEFLINIKQHRLLLFILLGLFGSYGIRLAFNYMNPASLNSSKKIVFQPLYFLISIFWNLLFLTVCFLANRWYLYFFIWVLPLFSVTPTLNIIRTIAEHKPKDCPSYVRNNEDIEEMIRTTTPSLWLKWLMYQTNFNYHVEHHLFPNIPFYNLPKLHKHLIEKKFYKACPYCLQQNPFKTLISLSTSN